MVQTMAEQIKAMEEGRRDHIQYLGRLREEDEKRQQEFAIAQAALQTKIDAQELELETQRRNTIDLERTQEKGRESAKKMGEDQLLRIMAQEKLIQKNDEAAKEASRKASEQLRIHQGRLEEHQATITRKEAELRSANQAATSAQQDAKRANDLARKANDDLAAQGAWINTQNAETRKSIEDAKKKINQGMQPAASVDAGPSYANSGPTY